MSSDNQYTALGPAVVGFQTDGTGIEIGAQITGNTYGIFGSSSDADTTGGVDPQKGTGVQGNGNLVGVVGESQTHRIIGPTIGSGSPTQEGVGVYGRGGMVGIYGDSQAFRVVPLVPSTQYIGVFGAGTEAGIEGRSFGAGNGVQGYTRGMPVIEPGPQRVPGDGVAGGSEYGVGVSGESIYNRGGIFQSDSVAQVQLRPADLGSHLPDKAQAGDLFMRLIEVEVLVDEKVHLREPRAELWLCVQPTLAQPDAPILWSKVRLDPPMPPT